ncbi:MAG: type II secretion system protein [Patescibacteria group bacterium]
MLQVISNVKNSQYGFTLIELLLVIGITLILAAASVPVYGNLQVSAQLNENTAQIIQAIRTARGRSIAGLNNASHGIYFEINAGSSDRFTLYQGSSYIGRNSLYDRVVTLDNALSILTTLSGNEVNFSKGLGVPNANGMVTLTHTVNSNRVIDINNFGVVEEK